MSNVAVMLQLAHSTARVARDALLDQTLSTADVCALSGSYMLSTIDDGDGVLSGGDVVDIVLENCRTRATVVTWTANVRLEIEQVDTAEAGTLQFFALFSFSDAEPGFRLSYVSTAAAESIQIREVENATPLAVQGSSLSDFRFRFEIGEDRRLLWMDATVQDEIRVGTYACETSRPFEVTENRNPANGTLVCTGGDDTRTRLVSSGIGAGESVQLSSDGGASFSEARPYNWPTSYFGLRSIDGYADEVLYPSAPNRLVDIATVMVAASPANPRIYAITRETSPTAPNALVAIDPATGNVSGRVNYDEEPAALALSRDGSTVYVGLTSTGAIYKYDTTTLSLRDTIELTIFPGVPSANFRPVSIAIAPNDPDTFVVSADENASRRRTLLVDKGTVQPRSLTSEDTGRQLVISEAGDHLYGLSGGSFYVADIVGDGLEAASETEVFAISRLTPALLNGIVYAADGVALDAEALRPAGRLELLRYNQVRRSDLFPPNSPDHRRGYRIPLPDHDDARIRLAYGTRVLTYDRNTYAPLSAYTVGSVGLWHSFAEAGGGYLAYAGLDRLRIVDKAVLADQPQPCAAGQTRAPHGGQALQRLRCNFGDAVYSAANDRIYATLRGQQVGDGNALLEIDPSTLEVLRRLDLGSIPRTLSVSGSGRTAWVGLDGSRGLLGVDVPSWTMRFSAPMPNTRFDGILRPSDVEAVPGSDDNVLVSLLLSELSQSRFAGLTSYQSGVEVTGEGIRFGAPQSQEIRFGDRADRIIGIERRDGRTVRAQISSADLTPNGIFNHVGIGPVQSGSGDVEYVEGLLYFSSGDVVDAVTFDPLPPFDPIGNIDDHRVIGVDTEGDRTYIYFPQSDFTVGAGIQRFVTSTREPDGVFEAPLLDQYEATAVQLITLPNGAIVLVTDHSMLRVEPDAFH